MHTDDLSRWTHSHTFNESNPTAERGTQAVMWITAAMMIVEILAGWWFNSMALLADGWHMSSHAVAIGVSAFAYASARRYSKDSRFAFGTWKIEILGGFASAIFLLMVAALMVFASMERIFSPQSIHYKEALLVAIIGLGVNVLCAVILARSHDHPGHAHHGDSDDNGHKHGHTQEHQDLNLRSAYVHVVADAATSVLAIIALGGGWIYGWSWLDPVMGIVGAMLVANWARNLLRDTGKVLLDREMDHPVVEEIREVLEGAPQGDIRISDLHVWRVARGAYACAISLATHDPNLTADNVRNMLEIHEEIVHATVEINHCA